MESNRYGFEIAHFVINHAVAHFDGAAADFAVFDIRLPGHRRVKDNRYAFAAVGANEKVLHARFSRNLDFPPSHDEVNDQDDQQDCANPASHVGTTVIKAPSASEKQQQNQNNQNKVHSRILQIPAATISHNPCGFCPVVRNTLEDDFPASKPIPDWLERAPSKTS